MTTVNPEGTGTINKYYPASVMAGGKVRLNFQVLNGPPGDFQHEFVYVRPPTLRESQEFQEMHRTWLDRVKEIDKHTYYADPAREKWVAEWVLKAAGGSFMAYTVNRYNPITTVEEVQRALVGQWGASRGPGSRGWQSPHGLCRAVREVMGITDAPVYQEEQTDEDLLFFLVATHLGKDLDEILEMPLPIYNGWIAYLKEYGPKPTDVDPAQWTQVRATLGTATTPTTTPDEGMVARPGDDHV